MVHVKTQCRKFFGPISAIFLLLFSTFSLASPHATTMAAAAPAGEERSTVSERGQPAEGWFGVEGMGKEEEEEEEEVTRS